MKDWIRRNATVIGAITGTVTLATTIVGSLLYFVVTKPMNQRFDAVEQRFSAVDQRFNAVEQRFDAVDQRFNAVEQRFDAVDQRFNAVDQRFKAVDQRFDDLDQHMEQGFAHAKEAREQDFAHLSQRFDTQDRRIEDLANDVSELRKLTVSINELVSQNERRIDVIEQQLQTADVPSP